MLTPWLDDPATESTLARWSEAIDLDLRRLGTTADADEIKDTAVTQPLVVAAALLAAARLGADAVPAGTVIAGHSVGELAAYAVAGVISSDDAVALAAVRGREMAAACALAPTGMSALLGGDADVVLARIEELGLVPANVNGAGQIVAAGALDALAELAETPPGGARVRPLPVAGAFHTPYMETAREALAAHAKGITPADPTRPLLTNSDGTPLTSGTDALERLVAQVTRPVRWDLCMEALRASGVTATAELPPAGALTGLVKRALKGTTTLALKVPADLGAVQALAEGATR